MTEEKPIDSNGFKLQVRYYIKTGFIILKYWFKKEISRWKRTNCQRKPNYTFQKVIIRYIKGEVNFSFPRNCWLEINQPVLL